MPLNPEYGHRFEQFLHMCRFRFRQGNRPMDAMLLLKF